MASASVMRRLMCSINCSGVSAAVSVRFFMGGIFWFGLRTKQVDSCPQAARGLEWPAKGGARLVSHKATALMDRAQCQWLQREANFLRAAPPAARVYRGRTK